MTAPEQYAALLSEEKDAPAETSLGESALFFEYDRPQDLGNPMKSYAAVAAVVLFTIVCIAVSLSATTHLMSQLSVDAENVSNPVTGSSAFNKPAPIYTNCGHSPATARDRGCSFDILSFTWQTSECYDEPLVDSFLSYPPEPWRWYTVPGGAEEVSFDVAALGERDLYVNWEYHVVHCTYMWMLMHRAYTVRGYIDSHLDAWNHTLHCQLVALEKGIGMDVVSVAGRVQYPDCRAVGGPVNEDGAEEEIGLLKMPARDHPTVWHNGG
ncbi:hypothetical protein LPUS_07898 [Lasallia pustulata]|uniref:Uncharacterized protein n=1 Tax=Lasallia pustulata TaxID=136370 RepID=A0A1W5D492_9LECA|nr:hypothetical protein LPUS_07898 [Lasallia pustulata]